MYIAYQKGTQTAPQGGTVPPQAEYKPPEMGISSVPAGS